MPTSKGYNNRNSTGTSPSLFGGHQDKIVPTPVPLPKSSTSPERRTGKWYSSPKLRSRARGLWGGGRPSPRDDSDNASAASGSETGSSSNNVEADADANEFDYPLDCYDNDTTMLAGHGESEEERDAEPVLINAPDGKQGAEKYTSLMSRESLRQALDDPIGLAKFGQFLANELGAEQLCFWLNSQQLSSDLQSLHSLCRRIHDLHVPTEAPLALNLSSSDRREVNEATVQLQDVQDPFAKCADRVLSAMHEDSWMRFVKLRLSLAQKAFVRTRRKARDSFCLADLREGPEQILCMLSKGFIELSGYSLEEALSMNCRELQGPDSSQSAIDRIRHALKAGVSIQELMINYTKAGKPFWVLLQMECLRDETGTVRYILGHQLNLSAHTSDLSWLLDDTLDIAETRDSYYVNMQKQGVASSLSLSSTPQHRSSANLWEYDANNRDRRLRDAAALAFNATAQRFAGPLGPESTRRPYDQPPAMGLPIPTSACAPLGILGVSTSKLDRRLVEDINQIVSPPETQQWQNDSPAKFLFLDPISLKIRFSSPSLPLDWAQGCSFTKLVEELNPRQTIPEFKKEIARQEYFTISLQLRVFKRGEPYNSKGRNCPLAITPLLDRQSRVGAVVVMFPW